MPGFDRNGPDGQGAASGRMRGMCRRTDYSAFSNLGCGRGRGMGMGQGRASATGPAAGMGRTQANVRKNEVEPELDVLKKEYTSARKLIEELQKKISALEVPRQGRV